MKLPDYHKSNLNLVHSLLKYYGVKTNRNGLDSLDCLLNTKKYKKIILLVMDGMGYHNLVNHNPSSILLKNNADVITTIYPSTTAAVMTMYESAKPVYESGWVSWSTYFKCINKSIDLFTGRESLTQELVNFDYKKLIAYESIYKMIRKQNPNLDVYQIYPNKVKKEEEPCFQLKYDTLVELMDKLTMLSNDKQKKFVFAYSTQPDSLMHTTGTNSNEVNLILNEFEDLIDVYKKNIDDETLLIISADHGLIDIYHTYYLNEYQDIMDLLVMPPLLEGRVRSFFVKNGCHQQFKEKFNRYFANEFILYTHEEILSMKLFGDGEKHNLFEDSIGDYVAIAVKNSVFDYISQYLGDDGFVFKGHHAGLTKEEMEIPLILIKKDDKNA